jgi:NAD(P)-dependent dehydrogenase (short-subunit alcohol dehydrogenase family)
MLAALGPSYPYQQCRRTPIQAGRRIALANFDRMVVVDLRAAFVATHMAVLHMRDGGRIIIGNTIVDYAALPMTSLERDLEFFHAVPLKRT